jgi:hypothetical protein
VCMWTVPTLEESLEMQRSGEVGICTTSR